MITRVYLIPKSFVYQVTMHINEPFISLQLVYIEMEKISLHLVVSTRLY